MGIKSCTPQVLWFENAGKSGCDTFQKINCKNPNWSRFSQSGMGMGEKDYDQMPTKSQLEEDEIFEKGRQIAHATTKAMVTTCQNLKWCGVFLL